MRGFPRKTVHKLTRSKVVMVKKVLGEEEEGETLGEAAAEETAVDAAELRLNRLAPEAIIDLRLSNSRPADEEIMRRGFTQLLPDTRTAGYAVATSSGSFGRGQSLWLWRQRQGSMRGRLKPIIDIQLNSLGVSSGLVLAGYTCLSAQVSGQWVWIKRAENDEQAADAIVDLVVTIGHQKDASDKIWTSPGVGWSRVDGNFGKGMMSSYDAFLWFRPLRARTSEAAKSSPLRTMVGLKDEMRLGVLLGVTKKCLRHAVPVERMTIEIPSELLPPKAIGEKSPLPAAGSSAASFDFSIHFHKFDKSNAGKLDVSKFEHMLFDVGLRMERRDVYLLFHLFNIAQDKVISRQEFWTILMLTELELDKTLDRLCASLRILAGSDEEGKAILGVTKLRINHNFRRIFRFVNLNHDGILSILDILKLCAELGVYVTEEEGRQLMRLIDRDRDDRIEEGDFLKCLNRNSDIVFNRAQRIREASSALRVWMVRNSGTSLSSTQHAAEKTKLWGELKVMHERSYGTAFVGFLTSDDLLLLFFKMGLRLTPGEAQELALIMAPGRNGNLQLPDLISFMASSCRSFGELCALMQRDIMKPLLDCYASYRGQLLSGQEHLDMKDEFDDSIRVIIKAVEAARTGEGTSDVVSVTQLKTGIETVMRGYVTPEELMPNLEEWASLCSLAGAVVVGEESVGVRVKAFLEGLCAHIAGPLTCGRKGESVDLLQVSVELQRVLQKEAELAGRGRKREYKPVFAMFDLDGSGDISLSEFNSMLSRLQLIDDLTEAQVPLLLAMFDRKKKNSISFDDFVHFGEMGLRGPRKNDEEDSDEEDRKIGLLSVNPPAAVTRDVSCDWLVWFLWKECTRKNAKEPENMVTELEVSCAESVLGGSAGYVEAGELWRLLLEVGLRGHLTRPQFDAGIKQLLDQGKSGDDEEETLVDYEALCRYIIRMGRAFNEQEQKNLEIDERRYQDMKKAFVRAMLDEAPNLDNTHSGTDKRANNSLRFERVFKRMDSNKDGKLTLEEFKTGLKELRYRGAKAWTQQMLWRLFEDIYSDNDGLLSLIELSAFIRSNGRESKSAIKLQRAKAERGDEDDEGFFAQTGFHITDEQLFAKVSGVLQEVVAPAAASERGKHSHSEMIKSTVRKFFQRSDEGARGLVSEARFKVFCRQTGLANKLSAQEMKMLMMRLSRRVGADLLVDYERLCSRISVVEISAPLVKGEGVLLQLQDAAIEAESAGRPFIGYIQ